MKRLRPLFKAIVAGVSACGSDDHSAMDASLPDVTSMDASAQESGRDASLDVAVEDAPPLDSYVAWCEAGPPELVYDGGCYEYEYVPCGLPTGDTVNEAGAVSRCDQVCTGADDCALVPPALTAELYEAGILDADTTGNVLDGGAVIVLCACLTNGGRAPEGLRRANLGAPNALAAYFASMAYLERASIVAFDRLRQELRTLGAPTRLIFRAKRAMHDEARHARLMTAMAMRFGARPARPTYRAVGRRSAEQIATENAVEGCARETYGALVATWQACHARDASVRNVMKRVAADETRHAELSWAVDRFLAIDTAPAKRRAMAALHAAAARPVHPILVARAGLPSPRAATRLLRALQTASL